MQTLHGIVIGLRMSSFQKRPIISPASSGYNPQLNRCYLSRYGLLSGAGVSNYLAGVAETNKQTNKCSLSCESLSVSILDNTTIASLAFSLPCFLWRPTTHPMANLLQSGWRSPSFDGGSLFHFHDLLNYDKTVGAHRFSHPLAHHKLSFLDWGFPRWILAAVLFLPHLLRMILKPNSPPLGERWTFHEAQVNYLWLWATENKLSYCYFPQIVRGLKNDSPQRLFFSRTLTF